MSQVNSKVDTIQCLRGIACLLVLLFHAALTEQKFWPHSDYKLLSWAMFGFSGVNLFFVISGFIITWVTYDHIGEPSKVPTFFAKRVLRIYPVFWSVYALLSLAMLFNAGIQFLPATTTAAAHIKAILLIPQDYRLYELIPVSWTLVCEMLFYAIFCAIIALPRSYMPKILLAWVALILLGTAFNWGDHSWWAYYALSPYNLEFILGCVASIVTKRATIKRPERILAIGCSLFLISAIVANLEFQMFDPVYPKVFAFGIPSFLIVLGLVGIERRRNIWNPQILLILGNASYSIYVVHLAMFQVVRRFTNGVETPFGPEHGLTSQIAWMSLLIAAGIGGGLILHYLVEKPVMDRSSRYFAPGRKSQPDHVRLNSRPAEECEQ